MVRLVSKFHFIVFFFESERIRVSNSRIRVSHHFQSPFFRFSYQRSVCACVFVPSLTHADLCHASYLFSCPLSHGAGARASNQGLRLPQRPPPRSRRPEPTLGEARPFGPRQGDRADGLLQTGGHARVPPADYREGGATGSTQRQRPGVQSMIQ
jgi:hypothetical protein